MVEPAQFDSFAGDYDGALNQGLSVSGEDKDYFARGRIAWLARQVKKMCLVPESVLDFGCGPGSATPFFCESFPSLQRVLGTDVSAELLQVARRTWGHRAEFRAMGDWTPDGSIDLAYCNGVFHHIPLDQRAAAMKYIFDALRPGGVFALCENNPWSPAARYVMSRIPFDRDAIMVWPRTARRLARQAGFQVLRTDYLFIFPRILRFLRPMERPAVKLPLGTQYVMMCVRR
jgi:SAM-dependent methyltransferase